MVLGIENQDVLELGIGNEEPIVIVHGQAIDESKARIPVIANLGRFFRCGIDDEDGADGLVGRVDVALESPATP